MIPVTINHIKYNVPVSWSEVTFIQAVEVIKNVDHKDKQLTSLTGIEGWVIDKCPIYQVEKLFAMISFIENLDVFESDQVKEEYKYFDFGSIEWAKADYCRKAMYENHSGFEAAIKIMERLIEKNISNESFLEWIGTANFFLSKSISFLTAIPSLAKMDIAMSRSKQDLSDYKILGALERTLKSQEAKP